MSLSRKSALTLGLILAIGATVPVHEPTKQERDRAKRSSSDIDARRNKNAEKRARRALRSKP